MEGAGQVPFPGTCEGECPETTVEIKIKTLDSQTYTLRVNKFVPVPALKEQIANVTGVLSEQQRLICRGKVLKDDELLSAYHVEDGHTLHLVARQPIDPSSSAAGIAGTDGRPILPDSNPLTGGNGGHNLIFGTVNLSGQTYASAPDLSRIFSTVISSLGGSNVDGGSEDIGSREHGSGSHIRIENRISLDDPSQIQVDQAAARVEFDQHQGSSPSAHPTVIPDSLVTLSQYINYMQRQFDAVGSSSSSSSHSQMAINGGEESTNTSQGLPTPQALADVVLLARRLLVEPVTGCLSELASQLQSQSTISDNQARSQIQSYSMRSGVLLQNLGSLLLELGRTIMTVRMGQAPEDAVVNAGPAIFISASSPNPIMVQAAIGLGGPGSPHAANVLAGGLGNGVLSRNIDIRIRRGNSVPVVPHTASNNGSERSTGQQPSGRADSTRRSVDNLFHQILQGVSNVAPGSGESTVRVVPIRTVIAIPAGVSRPTSDSSGNPSASFHPLFTRFQEQLLRGQNDSGGSAIPTEQVVSGQHPVLDTPQQEPSSDAMNEEDGRERYLFQANTTMESAQHAPGYSQTLNLSTERQNASDADVNHTSQQQRDDITMDLLDRIGLSTAEIEATFNSWSNPNVNEVSMNPPRQEVVQEDNQEGVFFSSLLHQIMPYILQGNAVQDPDVVRQNLSAEQECSSSEQTEGQHPRSAEGRRDPPNDPSPKRQKME